MSKSNCEVQMINPGKLVVVPSDALMAYHEAGYLKKLINNNYFNPSNAFKKVFIVSPIEPRGVRMVGDITVIGVKGLEAVEVLCNIDPDLIRGYGGYWACDFSVFSAALAVPETPVYISVHDDNPSLIFKSMQFADKVHCTSRGVQGAVIDSGVEKDRTVVVPNWIQQQFFFRTTVLPDFPESWPDLTNCLPILCVGRKVEQKNLETVIGALKLLPENYIAVFIGRGDETKYKEISKKLRVDKRCYWISNVENEELHKWYSWAHVMCTPSRYEGFGIVFIEALACGCNIVTSDIAPMNEFLTNGYNAVLVGDYESPSAVAAAILKFVDKDFSKTISDNAVNSAGKFSIESVQQLESREMLHCSLLSKDHDAMLRLRSAAAQFFGRA